MQRIKIDRVRKQITLKDEVNFFTGKPKVVKGKVLSNINYHKFDKDVSDYTNIKGLTYVLHTNAPKEDEDEQLTLKSKVTIDEDLKARYFAGLSEDYKIEIQETKEEFGL